jgi:hypothetical protein
MRYYGVGGNEGLRDTIGIHLGGCKLRVSEYCTLTVT